MTKKLAFLISGMGVLLFLMFGFIADNEYCGGFDQLCTSIGLILMIFIPTLVFSIVTYFIKDQVFYIWRNFSFFWIPITLVLIFLTPETTGNMLFDMDKQFVAMVLSGLYIIISLFLIIIMSIVTHLKSKKKL